MGYNEVIAQEKTLEMFSNLFEFEFEGLIDMIEKYDYDWPEAEDDNLDELLKKPMNEIKQNC